MAPMLPHSVATLSLGLRRSHTRVLVSCKHDGKLFGILYITRYTA